MFVRRSLASLLVGLGLTAAAAPAIAEGPTPTGSQPKSTRGRIGKVPFRVVKLLPETSQALVFDRDRSAHVLVSVGDRVGDFDIVEIDDEHLVVARDGREVMLVIDPAAPQPTASVKPAAPAAPTAADKGKADLVALLDPYLDLLDPYGALGVREVLAPPDQRASLQGTGVVDPYADPTAKPEPKVVAAPAASKPITSTPAPTASDLLRKDTLTIQRRELELALGDFGKLGQEIGFTRQERGVKLGKVASSSYFFGLGLRTGDLVTAIDGKPLRSLDDAAAAYARLGSAKQLAIDVERGGAKGTLRFALK